MSAPTTPRQKVIQRRISQLSTGKRPLLLASYKQHGTTPDIVRSPAEGGSPDMDAAAEGFPEEEEEEEEEEGFPEEMSPENGEEEEEDSQPGPFDGLSGATNLRGSPEDTAFFENNFPKLVKGLDEPYKCPPWYRTVLEGFDVYSEEAIPALLPMCSYVGLPKMGDRNYTVLYNPGGCSYKTTFVDLLGGEWHAINISSNIVAKGQDAVMFKLAKRLGEMEIEMLYDCKYSNPPLTHEPVARPAPHEPIVGATYLDAPLIDRQELRGLGARWDDQIRKWYVPQGVSTAAFGRWNPNALYNSPRRQPQRRTLETSREQSETGSSPVAPEAVEDEQLTGDALRKFARKMAMTVDSFEDTSGFTTGQLHESRQNSRLYQWQGHGSIITIDVARGDKMMYENSFWVMLENLLSSNISSDKYVGFDFKFVKRGFHISAHVPRVLLMTNGVTEVDQHGLKESNALPKKFLADDSPIGPDRPLVLFLDAVSKQLSVHLKTHEKLEQMNAELVAINQREDFENKERLEAEKRGMSGLPNGQHPPASAMPCQYFAALQTHFLRSGNDCASRIWTSDLVDIFKPGLMNDGLSGIQYDPLIHSLFRRYTPFAEFCAGLPQEERGAFDWLCGALDTSEAPFMLTPIKFHELAPQLEKRHFFQPLSEVVNTLKASEAAWRDGPLKTGADKTQTVRLKNAIKNFAGLNLEPNFAQNILAEPFEPDPLFDMTRWNGLNQGLKWGKVNSLIAENKELCDKQAALTVSYFFYQYILRLLPPKNAEGELTDEVKEQVKNRCMSFRAWAVWAWKL